MGSDKRQKVKEVKGETLKGMERSKEAFPAVVEELIGRTGFRGEITQVKCTITSGNEKGKSLRRNVKGPIQLNDVLMLREIQIEARRIRSKVNKGVFT